jgi:RHS repeat-associated protein
MSASVNKVGENWLVAAQQGKQCQVTFAYDYMGRRVSKVTEDGSGTTECNYVYDGWALIRERIATGETAQTNSYVYGLDLSGGLQGAGTIGGILATVREGDSAPVVGFYAYDANGNVTDLVGTNGTGLAHYEYDSFGNPLVATGVLAAANPFRFSTKYTDDETGLVYYGYRYYSPELGRWLSRDPLEEGVELNIYAFVMNRPLNWHDPFGLTACSCGADITDGLRAAMRDAERRFGNAPWYSKMRGCLGFVFPLPPFSMRNWDLEIEEKSASPQCPIGDECQHTVTVDGKCHDKWEVNYILYGKSFSLCAGSFRAMNRNIAYYKTYIVALRNVTLRLGGDASAFDRLWGDSDALIEWTPSLHVWATIGYRNLPYSSAWQPDRYRDCKPRKDVQGKVSIDPTWPW